MNTRKRGFLPFGLLLIFAMSGCDGKTAACQCFTPTVSGARLGAVYHNTKAECEEQSQHHQELVGGLCEWQGRASLPTEPLSADQ